MAITKNMVSDNKHVVNQIVTLSKELLFVLFLLALVLVLKPIKADAATINVVAGSSAVNADGNCQLEEAVGNINDGARTNTDCVETGTYGTDDTINLPAGTITGPGSSIQINDKSVNIIGQGSDSSIIDESELSFSGSGLGSALLKDFKMLGGSAMSLNNYDAVLDGMEIDLEGGIDFAVEATNSDLTIVDSYFHNGDVSGSGMSVAVVFGGSGASSNLEVDNSTFSQLAHGIFLGGFGADATATIKNSTFTGMRGNNEYSYFNTASGITAYVGSSGSFSYTTTNNTFSDMSNTGSGTTQASAIIEVQNNDSNETINHTSHNDVYAVGNGTDAVNYSQFTGSGSGSGSINSISQGGNLSSDNSFGSRLNHATDKNNVTTLASFLGVLSDNGGPVPTLALEEGSPAIDSGTNVSGMTTDARGVTRPQGTAFDSGAYESAFSSESNNNGGESGGGNSNSSSSANLTSPASSVSQFSNKPITITTPTGTTITSSNTVTESSLGAQDTNNQYPLGLVNFTFNTTQTDNLVTLTFITDLKPNQVKPRKYNPDTKAYTDITNYTLTETTINGQHALVLTYTITDNGDLDTNKTTGVISDPVGLAMTNSSYDQLANTGQNAILIAATGIVMVIAGVATTLLTKLKKTGYLFR